MTVCMERGGGCFVCLVKPGGSTSVPVPLRLLSLGVAGGSLCVFDGGTSVPLPPAASPLSSSPGARDDSRNLIPRVQGPGAVFHTTDEMILNLSLKLEFTSICRHTVWHTRQPSRGGMAGARAGIGGCEILPVRNENADSSTHSLILVKRAARLDERGCVTKHLVDRSSRVHQDVLLNECRQEGLGQRAVACCAGGSVLGVGCMARRKGQEGRRGGRRCSGGWLHAWHRRG